MIFYYFPKQIEISLSSKFDEINYPMLFNELSEKLITLNNY